jgi:hypothetical protein
MSVFLPTNTQQIGDEDEEVKSVISDLMLAAKEVYITNFPESHHHGICHNNSSTLRSTF